MYLLCSPATYSAVCFFFDGACLSWCIRHKVAWEFLANTSTPQQQFVVSPEQIFIHAFRRFVQTNLHAGCMYFLCEGSEVLGMAWFGTKKWNLLWYYVWRTNICAKRRIVSRCSGRTPEHNHTSKRNRAFSVVPITKKENLHFLLPWSPSPQSNRMRSDRPHPLPMACGECKHSPERTFRASTTGCRVPEAVNENSERERGEEGEGIRCKRKRQVFQQEAAASRQIVGRVKYVGKT